jgi:RNA polymerase sigma factor (sigma-70 family)
MAASHEIELLQKCRQGNQEAWAEFVQAYSGPIHSAIFSALKRYAPEKINQDRVQEHFQQVMLALCENGCKRLASFSAKNGCKLSTWLRVVVSRLVIDDLRRQPPASLSIDPNPADDGKQHYRPVNPADDNPLPPEMIQSKEAVEFVRAELAKLDQRERLIMQLRFMDGLSGEQTAGIVGISRNNVDQIVHRIKRRLKEKAVAGGYV